MRVSVTTVCTSKLCPRRMAKCFLHNDHGLHLSLGTVINHYVQIKFHGQPSSVVPYAWTGTHVFGTDHSIETLFKYLENSALRRSQK